MSEIKTMDMDKRAGDAAAIIDYTSKARAPFTLTVPFEGSNETVILSPASDGSTLFTTARDLFSDRAAAPQRRTGTIIVHDLPTFIAATNRDSDEDSAIFADVPARKVTSILDFHRSASDIGEIVRGSPRWGEDRIEYGFTISSQLEAWVKAARAPMDQRTFARLIDDRLGDVGDSDPPTPSLAGQFAERRGINFASILDLLQFTRTIAAKSAVESTEIFDENTGSTSIQYTKRNDVKTPDGAPIAVPAAFTLKIPILCGTEATSFTIAVRLRYEIKEKGIEWRVELNALDQYILAAIEEALAVVRAPRVAPALPVPPADAPFAVPLPAPIVGCGLPVFMGKAPDA